MIENVGRWLLLQGLVEFVTTVLLLKAVCEIRIVGIPVIQPRMMPGNQIRQHPSRHIKPIARKQRARSGVRRLASFALDMRIHLKTAGLTDVMLETWPVFTQVMPQAREIRPVGAIETAGILRCQTRHGPQMFSQAVRIAPKAILIFCCVGNRLTVTHM